MEEVASRRRLARLGGSFDGSIAVCQKREFINGSLGPNMTFYDSVLQIFLSARGGNMEVVTRKDDCASQLV